MDGSSFLNHPHRIWFPVIRSAAAEYLRGRLFTGVIDGVSVSSEGDQGDRDSYEPSISHDDGASGSRLDREASTRQIVTAVIWMYTFMIAHGTRSHGSVATIPARQRRQLLPMVSGDGSAVVFAPAASNLFPETSTDMLDLYIADISGGRVPTNRTRMAPARRRV